jgi:hypothetical protein
VRGEEGGGVREARTGGGEEEGRFLFPLFVVKRHFFGGSYQKLEDMICAIKFLPK